MLVHERYDDLLNDFKLLINKEELADQDNQIIELILKKTIQDVANYTNIPINELPEDLDYKGLADVDGRKIAINWRRTMVEDNLAKAQAVATLANFTSEETIAKNNPLVDDWQDELKAKKDDLQQSDGFKSKQTFKDDESDRVDE